MNLALQFTENSNSFNKTYDAIDLKDTDSVENNNYDTVEQSKGGKLRDTYQSIKSWISSYANNKTVSKFAKFICELLQQFLDQTSQKKVFIIELFRFKVFQFQISGNFHFGIEKTATWTWPAYFSLKKKQNVPWNYGTVIIL